MQQPDFITRDPDLMNVTKAIRCFGGEIPFREVLAHFGEQFDPTMASLRLGLETGDHQTVRKAMHWLLGSMTYLFSPAAERACLTLEEEISRDPRADVSQALSDLESVIGSLLDYARRS